METGPVGAAIDTSELYRYIWVQIGGVNCVWEKYRRWDFFGSHYILRAEVHLVLKPQSKILCKNGALLRKARGLYE